MIFPPHLSLTTSEAAGRSLTVLSRQVAGAAVLVSRPFCHVIHRRFRPFTCDSCYAFASIDGGGGDGDGGADRPPRFLRFPCEAGCGVHYCSAECRTSKRGRHGAVCGFTNRASNPGSKSESKSRSRKGRKRKSDKALETGVNLLLSAVSNPAPLSTLSHQLREDSSSTSSTSTCAPTTPGRSRRLSTYASTEASLRALLPRTLCTLPPGSYAEALSSAHLNAIGLYDEHGTESGYVLAPVMAMVNHSCLPNCSQSVGDGVVALTALRDIEEGEELSYSYVGIGVVDNDEGSSGSSGSSRKSAIRNTWGFTCRCFRCVVEARVEAGGGAGRAGREGDAEGVARLKKFDDEHVCACGAVCVAVDRTAGRECVCHEAGVY